MSRAFRVIFRILEEGGLGGGEDGDGSDPFSSADLPLKQKTPARELPGKGAVMENERELTTGLLSKGSSFRLIVTGTIGAKEIERLIKKLELDKEILAEAAAEEDKCRICVSGLGFAAPA